MKKTRKGEPIAGAILLLFGWPRPCPAGWAYITSLARFKLD